MRAIKYLLLMLMLSICPPALATDRIISKSDVDLIFSMKKIVWESYAPRIVDQKLKIKLKRINTGTGVMAFDPDTGMGLSIQPFYINDTSPPRYVGCRKFLPKRQIATQYAKIYD